MDPREFRNAVGAFATGVVVVTARDEAGVPVGVTANSFTSVSLEPPLILWCLAKTANSCGAFERAEVFAVHILSSEQEGVSRRFATRGEDKFAGVGLENGHRDTPLLDGSCTRLQCRTSAIHDGGDHIIIVGEVFDMNTNDVPPLVFHKGRYSLAATRSDPGPQMPALRPGRTGDALGYLLWRAFAQYHSSRWLLSDTTTIANAEVPVLYTLVSADAMSMADLLGATMMADREEDLTAALRNLVGRGLVREVPRPGDRQAYAATGAGRTLALAMIDRALACDREVAGRLGSAELDILKNLLRRFVVETAPDDRAEEAPVGGVREAAC